MLQQAWIGPDGAGACRVGEASSRAEGAARVGAQGATRVAAQGAVDVRPQSAAGGVGDAAIEAAFREHSAAVYGTVLRSTRDPEVAADVMQEAFVRLLLEARAGRYPDHVGGWLYRTSSNLVVSRARRADVERRHAPRLVRLDLPAQPDEVAVRHEERDLLRAALGMLSPADRAALLMAAEGASGGEIAVRLGRSQAATRTALCRARQRLRVAAAGAEVA